MGFWSDFKARRKYKSDLAAYNFEHKEWLRDAEIFKKCLDALNHLAKGKDAADDSLMRKDGELTIWTGVGRIRIPARTPSRYRGGSSGFSFPVTKGVRFRVGATRGTLVQGESYLAEAEQGEVVLTTQRIIFNGEKNSQEWLLGKLNGISRDPTNRAFVINSGNIKKTHGLSFDRDTGREFSRFVSMAMKIFEDGLPEMISEMQDIIKRSAEAEPKPPAQILPARQIKAIEG